MFARRLVGGSTASPVLTSRILGVSGNVGVEVQTRQAASLKDLKARMRSIENMKKITKAMKMVAAAKLKHDERRMAVALPFVKPVKELFERLPCEDKPGPITFFVVTSDKGLCGGVNSQVSKRARLGVIEEEAKGNTAKLIVMGNKGLGALKRLYGDRISYSFEECQKVPWTFTAASIMAEQIMATNPDRLKICTNRFRSLVSYDPSTFHIFSKTEAKTMDRAEWSKAMDVYSFEPALYEVLDDLHEFYYACVIHGAVLEAATCEMSSRMGAMENASKNATEMLDKVSLIYNRARQAKITTELCEIISGASAV